MNPEEKTIGEIDPKKVLKQRANLLAKRVETETAEGEFLHLLSFQSGEDRYAVELKYVWEVQPLRLQMWSLVPCAPGFIAGAVNLRGRVFSMMHIGRFLGVNTPVLMDSAYAILVKGGNNKTGKDMEFCMLSEGMPEMKKISQGSVETSSTTVPLGHREYVLGVTEDMLIILDLDRIFSDAGIIVHDEV